MLTEFGVDSIREGEDGQRGILSWQVRTAFEAGVAGTCVFAWTDEWFTGGHLVEDWAFGLVDRERRPKPSLAEVERTYSGPLPPPLPRYPRVSVVVCAYNAERTMDACLASLEVLNYPDYEVIVVNDGSRDRTLEIAESYPYCRIISQPNKGLSVARNVGAEAATGEIVAYTDSDCVADPDWLTYLVAKMEAGGLAACGGPNFPPPEDSLVPAAVAVAPGGPTHVLLSDEVAEHIAGCNMAFRRETLLGLGGFDPVYRAAGDDVDICWRFQDAGHAIGFSPAAMVWHFRRNTVKAYCNQQRGYGKAEALVYSKHPFRFNLFGQAKWLGRIYGDLSTSLLLSRRPVIYSGVFGRGLFQTLYEPPSSLTAFLPLTFEWSAAALVLALGAVVGGGWWWLLTVPLLVTWAMCVNGARKAPIDPRFTGLKARALVALLIYLGPLLRGWERIRWRIREMRAQPHMAPAETEQRARISWRERAFQLGLLERGRHRERGADPRADGFSGPAEIFRRARYRVERLGPEDRPRLVQPRAGHGLRREPRRCQAAVAGALRDAVVALCLVPAAQLCGADRVRADLGLAAGGGGGRGGRARQFRGDGMQARRFCPADASHHRGRRQAGRACAGRTGGTPPGSGRRAADGLARRARRNGSPDASQQQNPAQC